MQVDPRLAIFITILHSTISCVLLKTENYTSFNNFVRIIKNRELCFTDYRHLNDPMEILLSENVFQEAIQEAIENKNKLLSFLSHFSKLFSALINKESFNKVRPLLPHLEKIESHIYTFSFCAEKDYLPMWRWYGANGTGISLGFHSEYFKPSNEIEDRRPQAVYTEIFYEKEKLLKIINDLLNVAEEKIGEFVLYAKDKGFSEEDSKEVADKFLADLVVHLSSTLLPLMPAFKHHSYKDEKEHRLYYLECKNTYISGKEPDYFPFAPISEDRRGTRVREVSKGICLPQVNTEVPFVKSDKFSFDDIDEIWVGPCVHFECAREQIITLLKEEKLNIDENKIIRSNQPYR